MFKKRAVILAGGQGTRLRPYTLVIPKPLMPIGPYSILEIVIRQLVYHEFDHITIAVNHQAELVKAFCGDGSRWGVKIDYSFEQTPLGTIGPLRLIPDLPDNFLVMNGDVLTDLDYSALFESHVQKDSIFTISAFQKEERSEFGVLKLNCDHQLVGFQEKPRTIHNVSMGVYIANKKILSNIPPEVPYGFDTLMLDLIKQGDLPSVHVFTGLWLDIGRPTDFAQAVEDFERNQNAFLKG